MKKILNAPLLLVPLLFAACASAPRPIQNDIPDSVEVPAEETADEPELLGDEPDETGAEDIPYEIPEDFDEPEVIELEPEDEEEPAAPGDSDDSATEEIEAEPVLPEEAVFEEESHEESASEAARAEPILDDEPEVIELEPEPPAEPQLPPVTPPEPVTPEQDDTIPEQPVQQPAITPVPPESQPDETDEVEVIDITDEELAFEPEPEETITPSRSVTVRKNEYVDVVYPGTGWIFMGLTDGTKDVASLGRKLGASDTTFTLLAKEPGTKILHFYKQDNLTGRYIDDYLEVIVAEESTTSKAHKRAPDYSDAVPRRTAEKATAQSQPASQATGGNTTSPAQQTDVTPQDEKKEETESHADGQESDSADTAALLEEIKSLVEQRAYAQANKKLDSYFEHASGKADEALFLRAQVLEAESEIQDIKGAINAYTTLTKNYPASKFWDKANKRIIYLKRFYLEAR